MEFKSVSPNFVVAGMMKAGTSALQFNLNKHPQIYCLSRWWNENIYERYGFDESQFEKGLANKNTKETAIRINVVAIIAKVICFEPL